MKKSQSLKGRKFNIVIPKSSSLVPEKTENKNTSKVIIRTTAEYPDLHLPVKKIAHPTNKKQKSLKMNQISLEKLQLILLNLRLSKNDPNKIPRKKSKNKKIITSSPKKRNFFSKDNMPLLNDMEKHTNLNNKKNNSDITNNICNYNSENNTKKINLFNNININRNNSIEAETNLNKSSDGLQFRNKDKKWYNSIDFLTEKYHEFILTTENLEKNLLNKYLDGIDNIISEMEEPPFLKEDININTINANGSLQKHLSLRETTLDSSYQNSQTDKKKAITGGYILKMKNFRNLFKKYRTNFAIKSIKNNNKDNKENKTLKTKRRNDHRRKKKIACF